MPRRQFKFDAEKFIKIRNRIADVYQNDGDLIRRKKSIHTNAIIFGEMIWMEDEIERIGGGVLEDADKPRYAKIRRFLAGVRQDYTAAIKGGQMLRIAASVFGAMRFLSKCLEQIVRQEDDEVLSDTPKLPPEERAGRIEINLEEGIEDTDEETVAALKEVGIEEEEDADHPVGAGA